MFILLDNRNAQNGIQHTKSHSDATPLIDADTPIDDGRVLLRHCRPPPLPMDFRRHAD